MIHELMIVAALVLIPSLLYYWYQVKIRQQDASIAMANAAQYALKIWQNGSFEMPARLIGRGLHDQALIEIGHVLKAELVGRSTVPNLPSEIARSHPELAEIDSLNLAKQVQRLAQESRVNWRG